MVPFSYVYDIMCVRHIRCIWLTRVTMLFTNKCVLFIVIVKESVNGNVQMCSLGVKSEPQDNKP